MPASFRDINYLFIASYFIASDLLEELLETIALYRPIGRAVLHQLVQPQLERSFSFFIYL